MKPTSLIFLALSIVLLFCGWFTCSMAETMAESQGIEIFEQNKDKKGDLVYVYNLSDTKLSKLDLVFEHVNVNIVGSSKESYVELKNFEPYDYATTLSGSNVTVDGTVGGLSSLIDMSGGGIRFKGLRYFFADKPSASRARSVTVYLSDNSDIKTLNISLKKGTVTVKDVYNSIDYNINVSAGNVNFNTVVTESVVNVSVSGGEINVTNTECVTINANISGGIININSDRYAAELLSYNVKTENTTLNHNGVAIEDGQLKITAPSEVQKCLIKIDAKNSTIQLIDKASTIAQ